MFERFSDRARRVVVWAQEEARLLHHDYIGSEHLLLGLIHDTTGAAAQALVSLGISLDAARTEVVLLVGQGQQSDRSSGHIPFTPRAKRALEGSVAAAHRLGNARITPEHLLLGLLDVTDGASTQVLHALGVSTDAVRERVLDLSPPPPQPVGPDSALTPRAREVLEASMREAVQAGRRRIKTSDLLLGLVGQTDGLAARALARLGVDADAVWRALAQVQADDEEGIEDAG